MQTLLFLIMLIHSVAHFLAAAAREHLKSAITPLLVQNLGSPRFEQRTAHPLLVLVAQRKHVAASSLLTAHTLLSRILAYLTVFLFLSPFAMAQMTLKVGRVLPADDDPQRDIPFLGMETAHPFVLETGTPSAFIV